MKNRNFVAKHSKQFNKAAIHKDRKKDLKKGYRKHKNPRNGDFLLSKGWESLCVSIQ